MYCLYFQDKAQIFPSRHNFTNFLVQTFPQYKHFLKVSIGYLDISTYFFTSLSHMMMVQSKSIWIYMGVEPKIGGFYPQNGWYISWKTLLKWMIWGAHPYFWKHPYKFLEFDILTANVCLSFRSSNVLHETIHWITRQHSRSLALETNRGFHNRFPLA